SSSIRTTRATPASASSRHSWPIHDSASDWLLNVSPGPETGSPSPFSYRQLHGIRRSPSRLGSCASTLRRPPLRPGLKVRGMSDDRWNTVLVLGGIRSGKSAFAEALVADAPSVRYVATAVGGENDPEWLARIEAHQRRRPQSWSTEETGADPARLTALLTEAKPDDTLLVDDLGGRVTALPDPAPPPNAGAADAGAPGPPRRAPPG